MRGEGSLNHAILVVGEGRRLTLYNWSYRSLSFKSDIHRGDEPWRQPILCRPGNSLMSGPLGNGGNYVFDLNGVRWSISNDYEPGAVGGDGYLLSFRAVEPEFRPLSPAIERSGYSNAYWGILVRFDEVEILRKWLEGILASDTYQREGYRIEAVRNHQGHLEAVVACMPPSETNPRSCQNRFIRNGMTFSFRHKPVAKEQWIKMQEVLFAKVLSFKAGH